MTEDLKKFAEELKQVREEKNISLQSIYSSTRIDIKFLKAIEEGEFNVIDELYIKAFLREYSNAVGLVPAEVIRKYDLAKAGKLSEFYSTDNLPPVQESPKPAKPKVFVSPELTNPVTNYADANNKQILIPILGISILVIVTLLYLLFIKGSDTIIVQQKPFDEVLEERERYDDTQRFNFAGNDSTLMDSSKSGKLNLQIKASQKVWVRIIIDKSNQDEFHIGKDSVKSLNASHNFSLLLGDAGAVTLVLNGKPLNFVGKRGEIKNVYIDSTGLKLLYIKDKEKK
jgi:hypothetical protein